MAIIEADHITKEYRLGMLHDFKQRLVNTGSRLRGQPVKERPIFKALDDIHFEVEEGEIVGIIGQNGAGKSTLLKILSGITTPSSGFVTVHGKIAPLIEVGAGLVGEMTGRENIYLNGAILGIPRREINKKLDHIVDFAELEEFIDTPIKRYSSGMKVRLGFAIATSVDAEILIVDEVLAVGDLAFQRKCFDRMEELIKQRGNTVLLVSHNIRQVERLCSRVIMLDHGRIAAEGIPKKICELYYEQSNSKIAEQAAQANQRGHNLRMSGEVMLGSLALLDTFGNETDTVPSGEAITIRGTFNVNQAIERAEVIFGFHTTDFVYIASMGTAHIEAMPDLLPGRNVIDCRIDRLPLVPGVYGIRIAVIDKNRREMFYGESLKIFSVKAKDIPASKMAALGLIDIPAHWDFRADTTSPLAHQL